MRWQIRAIYATVKTHLTFDKGIGNATALILYITALTLTNINVILATLSTTARQDLLLA